MQLTVENLKPGDIVEIVEAPNYYIANNHKDWLKVGVRLVTAEKPIDYGNGLITARFHHINDNKKICAYKLCYLKKIEKGPTKPKIDWLESIREACGK